MDGCTPIDAFAAVGTHRSFVSGDPESKLIRVRYFRRDADGALVGTAWFGDAVEGPPGHAHGGSIAALMDEAMGLAAWVAGHTVVAGKISVEFLRMVPLGRVARFECHVESV